MHRSLLVLGMMIWCVFHCFDLAGAQCPEDPNDNGICDTMYVELWPCDTLYHGTWDLALVTILVTNDIPDPSIDSIAGFVIPLCFEYNNPAAACTLDPWWNNTHLYPFNYDRSIFLHLDCYPSCWLNNWMMHLSEQLLGLEWDTRILDLADQHFWMALFPTGSADQRFSGGSRVLLATMRFTLQDSTTICIDTCFWPPVSSLTFVRSDGAEYVPRHNLPYCFSISYLIGDCNDDGIIDGADVVFLINYLYRGGPAPPLPVGDVNCDGVTEGGDVVFLINYLFRGGPEPSC